ncbi:hypothetical protein BST61_g5719 [Cercospora zeina]
MEEIISKCVAGLQRCREDMRKYGLRSAAEHVGPVLEHLGKFRLEHAQLLEQHDAEIQSLKKDLADQKRTGEAEGDAKREAWKMYFSQNEEIEKLNDKISTTNTSIIQLHKDLDKEKHNALSSYEAGHKAGLEDINRLREMYTQGEDKIKELNDKISTKNMSIAQLHKDVDKEKHNALSASQAGHQAGLEEIKRLREMCTQGEAKIKELNDKISTTNMSITQLHKDLDKEKHNASSAYEAGHKAGLEAARQARPPANPFFAPPHPMAPGRAEIRQARLRSLMLTSKTGSTLPEPLLQALVHNDKPSVSRLLAASPQVGAPALHIAALFGDVDFAKSLLARGASVNEVCDARSEHSGRALNGVTPMHLAIAAQRPDMIRFLRYAGGSFSAPRLRSGQRTTAPPLWLVCCRFLNMFGDDTAKVIGVLRLLKQLGWNKHNELNCKNEDMRMVVWRELGGRVELRNAILAELYIVE